MKRSEMLDKIRAVLINELNYDYIIGLDRMVLEEIEEAGMLPPTLENKSFQILPSGEMAYEVNEWEPEIETI